MKQINKFTNLAIAEKRCNRIITKIKWWDKFVPNFLYKRWVQKTAWVDNYSWLSQPLEFDNIDDKSEDFLNLICIHDMWAGSINKWCDTNMVDNAPYCVRKSAKEFLEKRLAVYAKLG